MSLRVYYGGTFDPVHDGHLAIARAANAALGVAIRLMPAADPPHRAPPGATAQQRAAMLDLAVQGEPGLCVDRRELARSGPSYTVDTVRALRGEFGATAPLALLVGADSFAALASWKDGLTLFDLAHFVVAERAGSPLRSTIPAAAPETGLPQSLLSAANGRWTDDPARLSTRPAGLILRLRQPLHPASATDVRRRIAGGSSWRTLLPTAVADYIEAQHLYGAGITAARSL